MKIFDSQRNEMGVGTYILPSRFRDHSGHSAS